MKNKAYDFIARFDIKPSDPTGYGIRKGTKFKAYVKPWVKQTSEGYIEMFNLTISDSPDEPPYVIDTKCGNVKFLGDEIEVKDV